MISAYDNAHLRLFPTKALHFLKNYLLNGVFNTGPFSAGIKGATCGFTYDTIKVFTLNSSLTLSSGMSLAMEPSAKYMLALLG